MTGDLLVRSLGWTVRKIGRQTLAAWFLLASILLCTVLGLDPILREVGASLLLSMGAAGLLGGWYLADSRLTRSLRLVLGLLFGPGYVLLQVGRLHALLLAFVLAANRLAGQLLSMSPGRPYADPWPAIQALGELAQGSLVIVQRSGAWLVRLLSGAPGFDPIATALLWSLGVWAVSYWAAASLRSGRAPLTAVLPAGLLLGASLAAARAATTPLVFLLALTLLLMGWNTAARRQWTWESEGIDYSEDLRVEIGLAVAGVVIILTVLAAISPALTLRGMRDFFQALRPSTAEDDRLADSLGLDRRPAEPAARPDAGQESLPASEQSQGLIESLRRGGLPRRHLLGTGPELSKEIVMTISTGELPPVPQAVLQNAAAPRYYWSGLTYDIYTGRGWATGPTRQEEYGADEAAGPTGPSELKVLQQDVRPVADLGGLVYFAGELHALDQPYAVTWRRPPGQDPFSGDAFGATSSAGTYRADSIMPTASIEELRLAGTNYPDWVRQRFLQLPDSMPARVLDLARELTATQETPYDRAAAIEAYLRQYPYTLDIGLPPSGVDVADYFLFDLKEGYCDYYATAMVVLARAAGLPARMATGYAPGRYEYESARYVVTEADAHSWPEVYFPGYGWVGFEPTGGLAALNRSGAPAAPQAQRESQPAALSLLSAIAWGRILGWIAAVLAGIAALILAWIASEPWRLVLLSPRAALRGAYRDIYRTGQKFGLGTRRGITPQELGALLGGSLEQAAGGSRWESFLTPGKQEIEEIAALYARSLYSPEAPRSAEKRRVIRTWSRLRWRLWLARVGLVRKGR